MAPKRVLSDDEMTEDSGSEISSSEGEQSEATFQFWCGNCSREFQSSGGFGKHKKSCMKFSSLPIPSILIENNRNHFLSGLLKNPSAPQVDLVADQDLEMMPAGPDPSNHIEVTLKLTDLEENTKKSTRANLSSTSKFSFQTRS